MKIKVLVASNSKVIKVVIIATDLGSIKQNLVYNIQNKILMIT